MATVNKIMNEKVIKFCPSCGKPGIIWKSENQIFCSACAFTMYLNTAAAVALILECKGKILLAKRAHNPAKGLLDLPGGFIDIGESLEAGAAREAYEELGIKIDTFDYLFSFPNTYPFKNLLYNTCDLFLKASFDAEPIIKPADDVASIIWQKPEDINFDNIAFNSIRRGLKKYLEKI